SPATIGNRLSETRVASTSAGFTGVRSQGKFRTDRPKEKLVSNDVIVEEVRRVRHELVTRYGGLDGWIQHLQSMDRERRRKSRPRTVVEGGPKLGGQRPKRAS